MSLSGELSRINKIGDTKQKTTEYNNLFNTLISKTDTKGIFDFVQHCLYFFFKILLEFLFF